MKTLITFCVLLLLYNYSVALPFPDHVLGGNEAGQPNSYINYAQAAPRNTQLSPHQERILRRESVVPTALNEYTIGNQFAPETPTLEEIQKQIEQQKIPVYKNIEEEIRLQQLKNQILPQIATPNPNPAFSSVPKSYVSPNARIFENSANVEPLKPNFLQKAWDNNVAQRAKVGLGEQRNIAAAAFAQANTQSSPNAFQAVAQNLVPSYQQATQWIQNNPKWREMMSSTSNKKRYMVVYPDGRVEHVDSIEPITQKHPNYILLNSGVLKSQNHAFNNVGTSNEASSTAASSVNPAIPAKQPLPKAPAVPVLPPHTLHSTAVKPNKKTTTTSTTLPISSTTAAPVDNVISKINVTSDFSTSKASATSSSIVKAPQKSSNAPKPTTTTSTIFSASSKKITPASKKLEVKVPQKLPTAPEPSSTTTTNSSASTTKITPAYKKLETTALKKPSSVSHSIDSSSTAPKPATIITTDSSASTNKISPASKKLETIALKKPSSVSNSTVSSTASADSQSINSQNKKPKTFLNSSASTSTNALLAKKTAPSSASSSSKSSSSIESSKNSSNDLEELKNIKSSDPIVWFRTTDMDFWNKLLGDEPHSLIYFFNIPSQPIIEKDTKRTIFSNGTVIEEIIETKRDSEDDEPKVTKTVKVIEPEEPTSDEEEN